MKMQIFPEQVLRFAHVPETTVISIVSPGEEHPIITAKHLLQMHFHDVDRIWELDDNRLIFPMSEAQAEEIAEFVFQHIDSEDWIVHCEMGVSRSPGVALAITSFLGEKELTESLERRFPCFNRHVRSLLEKVLERKSVMEGLP